MEPSLEPLKKKMKSTDGEGIISDLNSDVWSHVVEYLQIGEVIMLSLVNQSIHQIISDHIRTIHPYCLDGEWSISRALLNHRSVKITKDNIERIQHIINQVMEKDEPISKFTKRFILNDVELKFDQVVKLFSAPVEQSITIVNRPIGFGLEQLEIIIMYGLTTSDLFKILDKCPSLTHLVFGNDLECYYDGFSGSVSYPVLNSLKSIRFLSCLNNDSANSDTFIALKIAGLSPNLEYLEFTYGSNSVDGKFLESLAYMCPKLKGIHLGKDLTGRIDYYGNYITDDEFFKFLQNEPHLEYIHFDGCSSISGSIYSKMGQFKQLKYFNVERKCYFFDEELGEDQCDEEPFTGEGVLPHLQYLNIGDEMEGINVDHLLKMAPNVKDVGKTLFHSSSNYLDLVDKLANRLTVIPPIDLDEKTQAIFKQKWLEKTTVLENAVFSNHNVSFIDFSKLGPIPSVKKLKLYFSFASHFSSSHFYSDLLKELFRVFPCVEVFYSYSHMRKEVKKTFIELIKEGKWPNLQHVWDFKEQLIEVRPHLTWKVSDGERVGSGEPFEKEWLQWDPIVIKSKRNKMERFFTNE